MRKQIIDMSFNTLLLARGISAAMFFALCSPCSAVEAQQPAGKVPRIGFLDSGSASDPLNALRLDAFRQGLRSLGYVEGKNINIEYRYAEGRPERLPELAEELVRLKVDILVVTNECSPSGQEGDHNDSRRLHDRRIPLQPGSSRVSPGQAEM